MAIMARFMRGPSLVGLATLCSALLGSPASACSTRHFYNHSNFAWGIRLSGGATCSIGRVNKATHCIIPPGQVADLHYPDFLANWGVPRSFRTTEAWRSHSLMTLLASSNMMETLAISFSTIPLTAMYKPAAAARVGITIADEVQVIERAAERHED